MKEVHQLLAGQLFTLPCERDLDIYTFVTNVWVGGQLDHSIVRRVASIWRANELHQGSPEQVILASPMEGECNPHALAKLVKFNPLAA